MDIKKEKKKYVFNRVKYTFIFVWPQKMSYKHNEKFKNIEKTEKTSSYFLHYFFFKILGFFITHGQIIWAEEFLCLPQIGNAPPPTHKNPWFPPSKPDFVNTPRHAKILRGNIFSGMINDAAVRNVTFNTQFANSFIKISRKKTRTNIP